MNKFSKVMAATLAGLVLTACEVAPPVSTESQVAPKATLIGDTKVTEQLNTLPAPSRQVDIAVYTFPDLTGQNKPDDGDFASLSRAVTQGGDAILVDVLSKAGNGSWFNILERRGIQNILRERQLIQNTRQQYDGDNAQPLPPLRFAGVLVEGGIVAYETNELTGGVGAKILNIGGNQRYKVDRVTVTMRMVSVTTSEVLISVTTTKNIYSYGQQGSTFTYVSSDAILETEFGTTQNDLPQFAVREAMELGVYAMIVEGSRQGLWSFRDRAAQARLIANLDQAKGDSSRVIFVQRALHQLGYKVGSGTGRYGSMTKQAIAEFQRDNGMRPTGVIDDRLINKLVAKINADLRDPLVSKALLNPSAPLIRSKPGSVAPIIVEPQLAKAEEAEAPANPALDELSALIDAAIPAPDAADETIAAEEVEPLVTPEVEETSERDVPQTEVKDCGPLGAACAEEA